MLLAIAVLLATSLRAVLTQPLGFETQNVVTMRIAVPESRYVSRDDTVRFYTELLDTLRAQPMVDSAGVVSILPLAGNTGSTLSIQGREDTPLALRPAVGWHWTSPGYFASIGIPIIAGRDFTADDVRRTAHVTVINEALARLHFPGEDPIGKRVYFGGFGPGGPPEWHEVIGIVGDVRHRGLEAEPDARAYDLFGQHWGRTISLAIRTSNSPAASRRSRSTASGRARSEIGSVRHQHDRRSGATRRRDAPVAAVDGDGIRLHQCRDRTHRPVWHGRLHGRAENQRGRRATGAGRDDSTDSVAGPRTWTAAGRWRCGVRPDWSLRPPSIDRRTTLRHHDHEPAGADCLGVGPPGCRRLGVSCSRVESHAN